MIDCNDTGTTRQGARQYFGDYVWMSRMQCGVSRAALARTLGVSERYLQTVEFGDERIPIALLQRMARMLDANTCNALFGERMPRISTPLRNFVERFASPAARGLPQAHAVRS